MIKKSVEMPKQPVKERIHNFSEVALGYSEEQAVQEASRCLQCPKPLCKTGCPVEVEIPTFIKAIKDRKFDEAIKKIREKNSLPAITGRVCPQEEQCQKTCVMGKAGEAIAIGRLERFAAEYELKKGVKTPDKPKPTGKRVAIVGSGPAGLTAAADLAKLGHEVTMFEALHEAGGVLMYGIPEFRLPKRIVQSEVEYVKNLGVTINLDSLIGKLFTVEELFGQGFDAMFIGTGAGLPNFLGLPQENLCGISSANEFLIRVNLMKAYLFPVYDTPVWIGRKVAVIGAGNVAMDAARCALRLGADEVSIVYRRSRQEAPARHEELENAEEEGVKLKFLTNPTKFLGNKYGWVCGMECTPMQLGEPDESGRRRPVPMIGSEFVMDVDTVVVAIGQSPNPLISQNTKGLQITKWGGIVIDEVTGKTSIGGVYAGGDIVSGAATVISAMGAGKKAAKAIHEYLSNKK